MRPVAAEVQETSTDDKCNSDYEMPYLNTSAFYDNTAFKSVANTLDGCKKLAVMPVTFATNADMRTNNTRDEDITPMPRYTANTAIHARCAVTRPAHTTSTLSTLK